VSAGSGASLAEPGSGPEPTGFGLQLRRLRLASRLTQEELAARSGLSVRAIADAESGRTRRLRRYSAERIAFSLGLPEPALAEFVAAARGQQPASGPDDQQISGRGPANAVGADPATPRELPAAVGHFVGRNAELTALTRLLDEDVQRQAGTVVISAIGGTAGVGKTALAISWAHQMADRFPDGQLYVNLRGYDRDEPVTSADALAGFLRALGVPGQQIPDQLEDRSRMYRSRLAGRRILVLLDNARDSEQVRPLLPGEDSCIAVLTSRDTLAGLVATDGAVRLDLDVLPPADATALLRSLIGGRVDVDPDAAARLAGLCARLPLALRIAAELAAARPAVPLAELAAELAGSRLNALDAGEDRADVRAVFSWSVRQLPQGAASAFALLGLHPGEDLDLYAVAAMTDTSTGQAGRVLARLHRASLLQAAGVGRYGMHDLLRVYAREQAIAAGQEAIRHTGGPCEQALTRLFDYYLAAAAAAMDVLFPAEARWRPRIAPTAAVVPDMPGEADARTWLDTERTNLVAVVAHYAGHGWLQLATKLATTIFRYLMTGSHLPEAQTIYNCALQAARVSGDVAAEAEALNGLGGISMMKGRYREAVRHYQGALERSRQCGNLHGSARAQHNLGIIEQQLRNHRSAADYYQQAVTAHRSAGDRLGMAYVLADLAYAETELGSYTEAADHLQLALRIFREANDQDREAGALERIGWLSFRCGELSRAAEYFGQALTIYRRVGHPAGIASVLSNLGETRLRQGEYAQAISDLRQALVLHRESGFQYGEIEARRILAAALHGAGQATEGRVELETVLQLAAETGNTYQQAGAHRDLAESSLGDDEARRHWQQALDLYAQLGTPEADEVRARLAADFGNQAEPTGGQPAG
jgi:tetratricopeptide (TPR) repeat protein/transcriptional regulator with XRE-family HTH domain